MRNDKGEQRQRLLYEGEQYGSTDCKPADAHEPEGRATPDEMQRVTHNTVTQSYSGVDLVVGTAPEQAPEDLPACHDPNKNRRTYPTRVVATPRPLKPNYRTRNLRTVIGRARVGAEKWP